MIAPYSPATRLHTLREQAGLSQEQLGAKLGLSQRVYAYWERHLVSRNISSIGFRPTFPSTSNPYRVRQGLLGIKSVESAKAHFTCTPYFVSRSLQVFTD